MAFDAALLSPRRLAQRLTVGIDGPLLALSLALALLGLATLFSASYESPGRVTAQLANLTVALAAMWLMAQFPPQTLMRFAVPAYVLGIALLVAVAIAGDVVNGARRWLHVGVTRFQPSEMMKLALPMMLAWYFHKHEATLRMRDFAVAAVLLAVPVLLIARQPDLGTAVLVGAVGFYVIFFAGIGWKVLATLGIAGLAGRGLPHHPVDHRGGLGRDHRQGLAARHADPPGVHPGAAHRFHLRG